MNHKRPPLPAIIIILLLVAVSVYFIITQSQSQKNGALTASGTVEAVNVNIAPELAGKVVEVLAEEGQTVKIDDPLLRLDDSLLAAQRAVAADSLAAAKSAALTAAAAYESAQAQYDIALATARAEDRGTRIADWMGKTLDYFEQPNWYFTRAEQTVAAQKDVEAAEANLIAAQANLDKVTRDLNNAQFLEAEKRLADARIAYLTSKDVYDLAQATGGGTSPEDVAERLPLLKPGNYRVLIKLAKQLPENEELVDAAQEVYDAAKAELDDAQRVYEGLLTTDAANQVLDARAALTVAREYYEIARDRLNALQTGEESLRVAVAAAAVEQAKAATQQAQDGVKQAESNLALLDTQIAKLTVSAPADGVILTRNVEPGEFVQPGATAFVLGRLSDLTITVYVPEDRYGEISIGQAATMTVDSFPDLTFQATVIQIADKAEFTPRNVQTVEGRSSTVYAVKLKVQDPEGKLKPGMPADVTFIR
jgi:multidrug resistance efflux pump